MIVIDDLSAPGGSVSERPGELSGDALLTLLIPHLQDAGRLAQAMLRDPHEAEDAVQAAFENALRRRRQLRDIASARAWFLRIVSNDCKDRLRRRKRISFASLVPWLRAEGASTSSRVADQDAIRRALAQLPARQREAVVLHHVLDHPISEVARVMDVPEGTAKASIHRAMSRLRTSLTVEVDHD